MRSKSISFPTYVGATTTEQIPMTADQFRDAVGVERARIIAMGCGYSRAYWSNACTHAREIPPDRLTCMLDALETIARADLAFVRAARKQIKQETT